jgi:hypothetical protein
LKYSLFYELSKRYFHISLVYKQRNGDTVVKSFNLWNLGEEYVKSLLENTIETYPSEWRLIHEALQNSIDSFIDETTGSPILNLPPDPTVRVELKLGSNSVKVSDNGKGVSINHFPDFLFLGSGTKGKRVPENVRKLLKGSQGVGIKATVFTSEHFKIRTICANKYWEKEFPNFSNYLDPNFTEEIEEPTEIVRNEPSGTELELALKNYSVLDFINDRVREFFEAIRLDDKKVDESGNLLFEDEKKAPKFRIEKVLMRYFKTQTYVGDISRRITAGVLPKIKFELILNCDFPKEDEQRYAIKGFWPMKAGDVITSIDTVEYLDFISEIKKIDKKLQPKIVTNYKEIMENGKKFEQLTVFSQVLTKQDIEDLTGKLKRRGKNDPPGSTENVLVRDNDKISANYLALYKINGAMLYIAPRPFNRRILGHRPTITVSVNGLPTDITLEVTGGALGYVPSVHFVLDVDETLGYGKRNLPPRSKGIYTALMRELWRNIQKLASFIVAEDETIDRTLTGTTFDLKEQWGKVIDKNSKEGRELLENFGRVTYPETEEDVVQAYFYLAGKGIVYPYKYVRLNDNTVYDALAVDLNSLSPLTPEQLVTVEFKYSAKQLCESNEEGRQRFQDIDLAIVWEIEEMDNFPDYISVPKEGDVSEFKYPPSANYRLKHGRYTVPVICLKDILLERISEVPPNRE